MPKKSYAAATALSTCCRNLLSSKPSIFYAPLLRKSDEIFSLINVNIGTVLPDLGRLLAVPSPGQQIRSRLNVLWNNHPVDNAKSVDGRGGVGHEPADTRIRFGKLGLGAAEQPARRPASVVGPGLSRAFAGHHNTATNEIDPPLASIVRYRNVS